MLVQAIILVALGTVLDAGSDCDCVADFDELVAKIESDYVGFVLEVTGDRLAEWRALRASVRERVATVADGDCVLALRELTEWFHDGHLFVSEQPVIVPEAARRLAAEAATWPMSEEEILAQLHDSEAELDPMEGLWYAPGERFAVLRDETSESGELVAVVLTSKLPEWQPGQVKARFRRAGSGARTAVSFHAVDHSLRHLTATLERQGLLLHMAPFTWGREWPMRPRESGLLDASDPRAPTLKVIGEHHAVLVSVPSHAPEHGPTLERLISAHRQDLLGCTTLIIDLRGDEGGSSGTTRALEPFYRSRERRPRIGPTGTPAVLSSPDNVAYFERMVGQGWIPSKLIDLMKANPGKIVPFEVSSPATAESSSDSVEEIGPRQVAILIDRGVASAGEAFLLEAMTHGKATVFGDNTAGMIDYQNVQLVPLKCRERGLSLGYPTIAASDRLPAGGLNRQGIAPQVRIPADADDATGFVLEYFARAQHR